jgi:AcrR family transcriptional regulator
MNQAVRTHVRPAERRTQAQRRAESEHRILRAAAELFAEQGYVNTTMEQIGTRAGFSAALVARKFGSKPGVIEALLNEIRRNTTAVMEQGDDPSIIDVIRNYVGLIAAGNVWSRALYVLMAESLGPLRDKADLFAQHNRTFLASIANRIKAAQRAGRADANVKPRVLAAEVLSRIRGATLLWLIDPDGIDFATLSDDLIESLRAKLKFKNSKF